MIQNDVSAVLEKISSTPSYLLGSTQIKPVRGSQCDHDTISLGLTLLIGILLDYTIQMSKNAQVTDTIFGDVRKYVAEISASSPFSLENLLCYLDSLDDALLCAISDVDGFKATSALKGLQSVLCQHDVRSFRRILCRIFSQVNLDEENGRDAKGQFVRSSRQLFTFLKKIVVDRSDLETDMVASFFEFEEELAVIKDIQMKDDFYRQVVSDMNTLLKSKCEHFKMDIFVPKHGSGVVADPKLKTWSQKTAGMKSDRRVNYLLERSGLGTLTDYGCNDQDESTRTSRYITVPKTWKKLRGISAEPAELQFSQQAVMRAIDEMFCRSTWWRRRVDLHNQDRSRTLALRASVSGRYATVDLSAASDSVSLQLVKDVFKNTPMLKWLLATRSVFTRCGNRTIRTLKFAPMGSACCFPVECIVFTLAAEIACSYTASSFKNSKEIVVYGDDIILPAQAVPCLLKILSTLGFSINTNKSYWEGEFREACGVEAWSGFDVSTCKFKKYASGLSDALIQYSDFTSMVSLSNELFKRGFIVARKWLCEILFLKKFRVGNKAVQCNRGVIASFDGASGTLVSPHANNYHLRCSWSKTLCQMTYKVCVWTRKASSPDKTLLGDVDDKLYTNWLYNNQVSVRFCHDYYVRLLGRSVDVASFKEVMESVDRYAKVSADYEMVCREQWVAPVGVAML